MFVKLYNSLVLSSLWSEDSDTCKIWITLLAIADRDGYIFGSPAGLAAISRLPTETVIDALRTFQAPDPLSSDLLRNPLNEGRRIEIVEGGWRILNYDWYRGLERAEDRKAQYRESKRRTRKKVDRPQMSRRVSKSPPSEAEAEAEAIKNPRVVPLREEVRAEFERQGVAGDYWEGFYDWWEGLGWKGFRSLTGRVRTWIRKRREEGRLDPDVSGGFPKVQSGGMEGPRGTHKARQRAPI